MARDADRVLISGDTDFGALLALPGDTSPSVILFRARNRPSAEDQASVILDHLDDLVDDLDAGMSSSSPTTGCAFADFR